MSLPEEMAAGLVGADPGDDQPSGPSECLIAKERRGCVSLWNRHQWEDQQRQAGEILRGKLASGRLDRRLGEVQRLGRLMSTRERLLPIAGRGRIVVPDGYRELLGVDAGDAVTIVGAAVCVELWNPDAWAHHLEQTLPGYRDLLEDLVG
ncbi:MAG: division/cell wall cluster transcriptional repressor MraZ [Planctomycetota bacterium]